jgi:alkylated DNA repair dioxygenase AlkB
MRDLFASSDVLCLLPVPDAEICYLPHLPLKEAYESLLRKLIEETPWRAEEITMWGKRHVQPRLTA